MSVCSKRTVSGWVFAFLILFLPLAHSNAFPHQVLYEAIPDWVETVEYVNKKEPKETEDIYLLLLDCQTNDLEKAHFVHVVQKFLTKKAVQEQGQVAIDFDPSYQNVVVHTLSILRSGKEIDQLPTCRRKVVHTEDRSESFVHTNEHTLLFFLDDLRKGDILELAYTIQGSNPYYHDQLDERYFLGLGTHASHLFYRLMADQKTAVHVKVHHGEVDMVVEEVGEHHREWRFEKKDVQPIVFEEDQPSWMIQVPWVQVSSFQNWQEVAKACLQLVACPKSFSGELCAQVESWKEAFPTVEGQIMEAIRFVQDEVRYLALDEGGMGYIPHHPNDVFMRRYGDCKDKTTLLVAICEMLGVKAYLTLVHSVRGQLLPEMLPGDFFNHAIVCIEYEGEKHFVDPTWSFQGGTLQTIACPPYAYALILSEETDQLTEIPIERFEGKTIRTNEYIIHPDHQTAKMNLTIYVDGVHADFIRKELSDMSLEMLVQIGEEKYEALCEKVSSAVAPSVEDDRDANTLCLHYSYDLGGLGSLDEQSDTFSCKLAPFLWSQTVSFPSSARQTPLAIPFPYAIEESVLVTLDPEFVIDVEEMNVRYRDDYVEYEIEKRVLSDHQFQIVIKYCTLQEMVQPEDLQDLVAAFEEFAQYASLHFSASRKG